METTSDNPRRYPIFTADWVVITIYVALLAFGWLSICGASHEIGDVDFFSWGTRTGKQLVWIGLAFTLGFFLLMTDDRYFENLADLAYWGMMLVLLVTPFLAKDIKGSKSWISLGAVSLQPAEFAKCVTALAVAKLINRYGFSLDNMRNFFKAASLVLLPMVLIVMQRETGSALVYLAFFLMFYREGMPGSFLFTATAAVAYFVIGIRFSTDILPYTQAEVGEFVVLLLIWLFTTIMTAIYCPRTPHASRLFTVGAVAVLVAYLVSRFVVPFDIVWVQIAVALFMTFYMGWQALGERIGKYLFIAVFSIGSTAFL